MLTLWIEVFQSAIYQALRPGGDFGAEVGIMGNQDHRLRQRRQNFNQAFLISFMGFFVCILIEISNIVVLLYTADTLNLVSNFVSLVIIA